MDLEEICRTAHEDRIAVGTLSSGVKDDVLCRAAECLLSDEENILAENARDVAAGEQRGMPDGLIDRLRLDHGRLCAMADGMRQVAALPDPIGEVLSMKKRPNGLLIGQKRVPLGVVGMIYEARPNVTTDAFALCFKTGNCVILKGGSDAIRSNTAITAALSRALFECGIPSGALSLITDTNRSTTEAFMKMDRYVDLLIPRGGAGLIQSVVQNATVPVIETGTGNCHVYVDSSADQKMALSIIENAKTQRIGVCNACESIVVHRDIAKEFLPKLYDVLEKSRVQMRGDEEAVLAIGPKKRYVTEAEEDDWGREYLDYILSVKTVSDIDEAIAHINRYNSGHSEAIVTESYRNAQKFLEEVDAACVYVNASTRFSDGNEFGLGAEIGISTQKLHARGPMGLSALTSTKYIIYGNGQIRS